MKEQEQEPRAKRRSAALPTTLPRSPSCQHPPPMAAEAASNCGDAPGGGARRHPYTEPTALVLLRLVCLSLVLALAGHRERVRRLHPVYLLLVG